ncbi:MAG TPA: hypothetical protein VHG08_16960 [Longimicrobium sp.]|nr:hypothetical protein [Longimicrobium sp.]
MGSQHRHFQPLLNTGLTLVEAIPGPRPRIASAIPFLMQIAGTVPRLPTRS